MSNSTDMGGGESKCNDSPRVVNKQRRTHGTLRGNIKRARTSGMIDQDIDSFGDQADEGMQYCMDNPGNATHIIEFHPNILNKNKLQKMIFQDEIPDGFVGLDEDGDLHPLHPTHHNDKKHSNDKKWNGYGIGGGDAQMNTCEEFEIYTKYKTKNGVMKTVNVKANWQKLLENEQKGEDSFPEQIPITMAEYHKNHKNDKGSTLIYNDCREEIYDESFDNIIEKATLPEIL